MESNRGYSTGASALPIILLALMTGCGGGGGGGGTSQPRPLHTAYLVQVSIQWAARSRLIEAPASALSAVVTLANASPSGGDATFTVNRRQDPSTYTQAVSFPSAVGVGHWLLSVRFFAQSNGNGSLVGVAATEAAVGSDASLTKPGGSPLGLIEAVGTISTVTVAPLQTVTMGQDQDLVVTASDVQKNVIAVSPGSIVYAIAAGGAFLSATSNGRVHGITSGVSSVTAIIDGKRSAAEDVYVSPPIQVRRLNLRTNDLAFDPVSGRLYASVPGTDDTGHANCIVAIDPASGTITGSVPVGGEPNRIALSDDGHYLYVGLDRSSEIRRVDVHTLTAGIQFSLGASDFGDVLYCGDMAVMPGSPGTVVVALRFQLSPSFAGLVVFDDGKPRAKAITWPALVDADWISFGAMSDRLYGYDSADFFPGDSHASRFTIDSSGIYVVDSQPFSSSGPILFAGGVLYTSGGGAVAPETYQGVGQYVATPGFSNTNGFAVDTALNRAYFISANANEDHIMLNVFDRSHFIRIAPHVFTVRSDYGERNLVPRLVLCGNGRLAFNTHGGDHPENDQVVIITPGG